jgi:hypothetical protein
MYFIGHCVCHTASLLPDPYRAGNGRWGNRLSFRGSKVKAAGKFEEKDNLSLLFIHELPPPMTLVSTDLIRIHNTNMSSRYQDNLISECLL